MIGHLDRQAAKEAADKASRIWRVALMVSLLAIVLTVVLRPRFEVVVDGVRYAIERVEK